MNELKELFEKMTVDNLLYVLKALGIKAKRTWMIWRNVKGRLSAVQTGTAILTC